MKLVLKGKESAQAYSLLPRSAEAAPKWIEEGGSYQIVYEGALADGKPELALSGVAPAMIDNNMGDPLIVKWGWAPKHYAGRLVVNLRVGGKSVLAESITLHPQMAKLTQAQFDLMLTEILAEAETCFALSPVSKRVSQAPARQDRPLADLEFARSHFRELDSLVELLERSPSKRLEREANLVPTGVAAPDDSTADWVAAEGAAYLRPARAGRNLAVLGGFALTQVQVRPAVISLDTPENRFVRQFLRDLRWRLLRARTHLAPKPKAMKPEEEPEESEVRVLRQARLDEVSAYIRRLNGWLERPLFQAFGDSQPGDGTSHVLRKHPLYARFFRLWSKFRRRASGFDDGLFAMPLESTWQLYEYWCFIMVVKALRELGQIVDTRGLYKVEFTTGKVALALVRGNNRKIKLQNGHRLYFQRQYGQKKKGLGCATVDMKPDIVLELYKGKGIPKRVLLLDPKYRASSASLGAAAKDLHAYSHGIRWYPEGVSAVTRAIILAPVAGNHLFEPGLGKTAGVEGLQMVPGAMDTLATLKQRLAELMGL